MQDDHLQRWRLILGKKADAQSEVPLDSVAQEIDNTLDALYDSEREGGLGISSPNVHRWLGDIRKYFPTSVVQVLQKDAIERLGVSEILRSPELVTQLEVDVNLASTLVALKEIIPQETKETARELVAKIVKQLEERLQNPMREALEGALHRSIRNRRPKWQEIDWHRTIKANLKHYQAEFNSIIPEQLIGYGKKGQSLKNVILLVDQSASMASSVVYASVFGAIMASIRSVRTHFIAFDTQVVNLTEYLDDPVDLLFGTQLGGGTDIANAMAYTQKLLDYPNDTIVVLISDLYEGGDVGMLYSVAQEITHSGAQLIGLLSLNDEGKPSYDRTVAAAFGSMNIPIFACTPNRFPELMAAAIKRENLDVFVTK
ncbi:MAG: VWA domain-containing protein [Bacteroidota bacterium]